MSTTDAASTQLHELAEFGMGLVRRIAVAVDADPDTQTLIALADAHCDVARSVRQSIALRLRIASGSFERVQPRPEADPDAEPEERKERGEYAERCDWNEYERPDWETPLLRLTGDPAHDEAVIQAAVAAAVVKIRRSYAKALAVLDPERKPTGRTKLLAGSALLRLTDTS
ncbi:hypothetical protein [Phenylobacterium sp.]|uniref:hypothetical protein n=1 Tax=Phenylobacterium sp. TaxID=1871053 RepID=UPI0025D0A643|nr:hypothetical protein [Phenylobacterium sp.]MBX3482713.1 hypothetical protein [Phenylobacterium sp.]